MKSAPENGGRVVKNCLGRYAFGAQLSHERTQARTEIRSFLGGERLALRATEADGGATSVAKIEQVFRCKAAVGFRDGVVVYAEFSGKLANARQWVSGRELTGLHQKPELVDDLTVGRRRAGEIDGEGELRHR
jgi:hypothetical protein